MVSSLQKHETDLPKTDGSTPIYTPSSADVDNALTARKAIKTLFRNGNLDRLDNFEKKSLSSFSFGCNQFVPPPQTSSRVLSCVEEPTDVTGLMGQETTSGGSLKFLTTTRMQTAAWACEIQCFPSNPQPDVATGIGKLEIKAETLRFVVCAGRDLLQDAAFNIERWILRKTATGFRNAIS